jgi:hypothetical protein
MGHRVRFHRGRSRPDFLGSMFVFTSVKQLAKVEDGWKEGVDPSTLIK